MRKRSASVRRLRLRERSQQQTSNTAFDVQSRHWLINSETDLYLSLLYVLCSWSSIGCETFQAARAACLARIRQISRTLPTRKYEGRRNTDVAILLSTQGTLHTLVC